jgi:uncharacterized protein YecE (DUF72 family)
MARLYAGTSGFAFPTWKPAFYPEKLPQKKFLSHYASRLNAVEINYTFHRLPTAGTLEGWLNETHPDFLFVVKAHQRLTHLQRLAPSPFTEVFFQAIDPLRVAGRLGPVLFQLPPNLPCDPAKLADFLAGVPPGVRLAFEFRHKSWLTEEIYDLLESRGVSLCLAESDKLVIPERLTADFVYLRLRKSEYTTEDRAEIAARATQLVSGGRDAFVFFKHEDTPDGALHAQELLRGFAAKDSAAPPAPAAP